MESIENKIKKRIASLQKGVIFFPDNFNDLGSSEAIRISLFRLEESGFIKRVAQGIYVRPKTNEFIGEVMPTAEEVAQGIAKRDKIKLVPTGAYALNALGLSTQVPLKLVFLTDGAARTVNIGKRTIKFKRTTPKNLLAKGSISSLVIQALKEIGKDNATQQELDKIKELLQREDPKKLAYDITLAPVWIQKLLKQALTTNE